jgi:hypothetical protein
MRRRRAVWVTAQLIVPAALTAVFSGCATIASGAYGHPLDSTGHASAGNQTDSGLLISGQEIDALSSADFGVLQVTIENNTNQWVRLSRISLDFGSPVRNEAVAIPLGPDLDSWTRAAQQRAVIQAENTAAVLALAGLAFDIAGAARHHSAARAAGQGLTVASLAAEQQGQSAAGQVAYPDDHLFTLPFNVPPGLFTRRWIVLNSPPTREVGCLDWVVLDYDVVGRGRERVQIQFRNGHSDWQSTVCETSASRYSNR